MSKPDDDSVAGWVWKFNKSPLGMSFSTGHVDRDEVASVWLTRDRIWRILACQTRLGGGQDGSQNHQLFGIQQTRLERVYCYRKHLPPIPPSPLPSLA